MGPGPRILFQRGLGPNMPRGGQPFGRGIGPGFMPPGQGSFRPGMMRGPQAPQVPKGGGGLLSRLFGRSGGSNIANAAALPAVGNAAASGSGGSFLKTLANPEGINGFLANTQQVLNSVQSMGPMVQQFQQYAPLVRNLPAMWKLYKGVQDTPDSEVSSDSSSKLKEIQTAEPKGEKKKVQPSKATVSPEQQPIKKGTKKSAEQGKSVPKLFI